MTENSKPDFWQMQSELDIRGLIAALSSEDKLIRRRAAAALRSMHAVAAIPALQKAHGQEEDPETGMIIAAAIESLADTSGSDRREHDPASRKEEAVSQEPLVKRLMEKLKSDDAEAIIEAAQKLGEMGEKIAVESLILAFNNPRHTIHVRLAIAEALLKLESAPVEVALLANLRHTDWHIRRNGAAILGQLRAEWAVEPLSRSLSDPHPVVRRTALAALKHIGTPESRKALAQFDPSDAQSPQTGQDAPREVSGIEVKRPGKQQDETDESSLLRRLSQRRSDNERARRGTQPLNPETLRKAIDQTQPLREDMLGELDALLAKKKDKEQDKAAEEGSSDEASE